MALVKVTPEAHAQFLRLPVVAKARVEKVYLRLRHWPAVSGAKSLRGNLAGRYRIRTGDYRVQFRVAGDIVTIEQVGHRDGFYGD